MEQTGRLREGWPSLLLIWAMLLVTSVAVLQADLTDGLHVVPIVATLALAAGWLLGKSIFTDRAAHIFALIYGLFVVFYFVGSTLSYEGPWRERVLDLITRQVDWLGKAIDGGTSRDGLIFVIQTTAVFWILGYFSGWRQPRAAYPFPLGSRPGKLFDIERLNLDYGHQCSLRRGWPTGNDAGQGSRLRDCRRDTCITCRVSCF